MLDMKPLILEKQKLANEPSTNPQHVGTRVGCLMNHQIHFTSTKESTSKEKPTESLSGGGPPPEQLQEKVHVGDETIDLGETEVGNEPSTKMESNVISSRALVGDALR